MNALRPHVFGKNGDTPLGTHSAAQKSKVLGVKNAVAASYEGKLYDLSSLWPEEVSLTFIKRDDPEALSLLRHDAAHIMAQAVKELFSNVQVTIGPATSTGFYYDFKTEEPFKEEDLEKIEARMHEIVDRDLPFEREEWPRHKAIAFFKEKGEHFKAEIINDLPEGEVISVYRQGEFIDLCKGPHLPSTGVLGHGFKLLRLAGAYWRGDAKNPMLQRIYGTAFPSEKALRVYLKNLEEAAKRDHRLLGKQLSLFHFQEEAAGSVFWHPKGWSLYTAIETYIRERLSAEGYAEVKTPQMLSRHFWEKSGHWDKFRENMISCALPLGKEQKEPLAMKPMNCPGHVEIFKKHLKSYKDLPLRLAEFGSCIRFEPSGSLLGLMRVRAFTQDDAHIFCTPQMIESETQRFCRLLKSVYADFGFEDIEVKFSDRPALRAGEDKVWDRAEEALIKGASAANLTYTLNPGEGAFYGPKLEFVLKDTLGRSWQCGTLQVDMVLPDRLEASYIGEDGKKHTPVMLHRAILGSFERFIGILIEHYGGNFPLWMAPIQVAVLPLTNEFDHYAKKVYQALESKGLRVFLDERSQKIHAKIREQSLQKIPYLAIVGGKEALQNSVTLRQFGKKTSGETLTLKDMLEKLALEAEMPHTSRGKRGADFVEDR